MPNHALCVLTGHLGPKIEQKSLPNGTPLLKFSLCVNTGFGDKKIGTWWNCTMFGDRSQKVATMLAKGDPITIVGEPSLREYSTDSGKRQSLDVRVSEIVLLRGRQDAAPAADASPEADDGSIPF